MVTGVLDFSFNTEQNSRARHPSESGNRCSPSFPGAGRRVPWLRAPPTSHCSTWCTLGPGQASAPIQSSRWLGHPRSSPWLPWLSVATGWSETLFTAPPSSTHWALPEPSGVGESGREGQLGPCVWVSADRVFVMGSLGPETFPESAAGSATELGFRGGVTWLSYHLSHTKQASHLTHRRPEIL